MIASITAPSADALGAVMRVSSPVGKSSALAVVLAMTNRAPLAERRCESERITVVLPKAYRAGRICGQVNINTLGPD